MSRHLTALVIGNAAYDGSSKLRNPGNDADDVAAKLDACGFEVVKLIDCSNSDLDRALKRFKRSLVGNDVGLFCLRRVAALSVFRTRLNMLSIEQSGVAMCCSRAAVYAPLRPRPSLATCPGEVA